MTKFCSQSYLGCFPQQHNPGLGNLLTHQKSACMLTTPSFPASLVGIQAALQTASANKHHWKNDLGLGLHDPSQNPICQPENCTVHFLLVSPTAATLLSLAFAGKSCVQLPMHRQGWIQEKLHSNSESFFRHANSQKILLEAQTPVSNQCSRHVEKWAEPGKPWETAFKTWPNGEPINWHHQIKICFFQTSFVMPPSTPDSVISIGILAEDIPARGKRVGLW